MRRLIAAIALFLPTLASAQERYLDRDGALAVAQGPAASEIRAELTRKSRDCNDMAGTAVKCALADNALDADAVYGESPVGERMAFVSVRWQSDPTGNAVEAQGLVFLETAGVYRLVADRAILGESVSGVRFEDGRVSYIAPRSQAGDSRAKPTGGARVSIPYGTPRGNAPTVTVPEMKTHGSRGN